MFIRFAAALAAYLLTLIPGLANTSHPCTAQYDFVMKRAFPLFTGERFRGMSVALNDHYLLTNFHVAGELSKLEARYFSSRKRVTGKVVLTNKETDLTLIKLDTSLGKDYDRLILAAETPKPDTSYVNISYQMQRWVIGKVKADNPSYPRWFLTEFSSVYGDSGSGLFDCNGTLIGEMVSLVRSDESRKDPNWVKSSFENKRKTADNSAVRPEFVRHFVCGYDSSIFEICSKPQPPLEFRSPAEISLEAQTKSSVDQLKNIFNGGSRF